MIKLHHHTKITFWQNHKQREELSRTVVSFVKMSRTQPGNPASLSFAHFGGNSSSEMILMNLTMTAEMKYRNQKIRRRNRMIETNDLVFIFWYPPLIHTCIYILLWNIKTTPSHPHTQNKSNEKSVCSS